MNQNSTENKNATESIVMQGAAKPFNDLSRGCLMEDIVLLTSMTLMQLKGMEDAGLI